MGWGIPHHEPGVTLLCPHLGIGGDRMDGILAGRGPGFNIITERDHTQDQLNMTLHLLLDRLWPLKGPKINE